MTFGHAVFAHSPRRTASALVTCLVLAGGCGRVGFDLADGGDGGGGGDGGEVDAPIFSDAANGCVDLLVDDMSGAEPAAFWLEPFYTGVATAVRVQDQLRITPPTGLAGINYAGYASAPVARLGQMGFFADMVQVTTTTTPSETILLVGDGVWEVSMVVASPFLELRIWDADHAQPQDRTTVAYDPAQHRHWQIRLDDADAVWETSANGVNWVEVRRAPNPLAGGAVSMTLTAGTYGLHDSPGQARIEEAGIRRVCGS